jgi:chorismate synthase
MTTGAPIAFFIDNKDVKIVEENNNVLKPSHASFVLKEKFGHHCNEQGGRFSARQTACRVVGGAIAKLFLQRYNVDIKAAAKNIASAGDDDTAGATVECWVRHVPAGLGEPAYGGLDARLAAAMLSIPACKGFEIGEGFAAARMTGSQYNDLQVKDFAFCSNHDGGIQAGISNGQDILFHLAFKPIPSLPIDQATLDFQGKKAVYKGYARNDKSVVPRVLPVVEAMAALVIADAFLINFPNLKLETCSKHLS